MFPIEYADLLASSRRISGERERDRVTQRSARGPGRLFFALFRGLPREGTEKQRKLGGGGDPLARLGIGSRELHTLRGVVAGEFVVLRPAIERAHRIDYRANARTREAVSGQLVNEGLQVATLDAVEASPGEIIGNMGQRRLQVFHCSRAVATTPL